MTPMAPGQLRILHLGFVSAVAQAVLLREAMAALVGSEMAWGTVVGLWLAGMALGARIGTRWGSQPLARISIQGVLVTTAIGTLMLRATPALVGTTAGETVSTWGGAWVWVVAVLPSAVLGGLCFPILTPEAAGTDQAGAAYALEALGGLLGGLGFTFVLAPFGTAATLAVTLAASVAVALRRRPVVASAVLALGVVAAWPSGEWLATVTWRWAGHPGQLEHWHETRHQRLELGAGPPWSLYANGAFQASYPDQWRVVPRAHLLALLHPRPNRVLLVGGLADGTVVPLLRHPIRSLDMVEEDPALAPLLSAWYDQALTDAMADPRVHVHATDPLRAVRHGGPWELILLLDSDPATLRRGRTRTVEFFRACQRSLTQDGVLVVGVGVNDTYLGGAAGDLLTTIAASLDAVFGRITAVPGESVLLLAGPGLSETITPDGLGRRWEDRAVADPDFVPEMLSLLLEPQRQSTLNAALAQRQGSPHTVLRPRAILPATAVVEGRGGHPPLVRIARALANTPQWLLLLAVAGVVVSQQITRSPAALAASVGFVSMGWWLTLLAVWQSTVGSVYTEVGALTAAFMAGAAAGALVARGRRVPNESLPWLLIAAAGISLAMATGVAWRWPRPVVPVLLLVGGALTGATFPLISARFEGATRHGAGRAWAGEEAGAAAAAMAIGIAVLPWAGIRPAALVLAVVAASAATASMRRQPMAE